MLKNNIPHYVGFGHDVPPMKFELYQDELQALAAFAATTDKKEMANVLRQLAEYSEAKAKNNRGPVRFTYS